jgi:hypothetical protein
MDPELKELLKKGPISTFAFLEILSISLLSTKGAVYDRAVRPG